MKKNDFPKKALNKIKRVRDCIYFNDPDRPAIQDMFIWDDFIKNWKKHFCLDKEADIHKYYDFDLVCCSPNIDPVIENVKELERCENYVIYRGGFGSILRLDFSQPVPGFIDYAIKDMSQLKAFRFEDPHDNRRYENSFALTDQFAKTDSFEIQLEKYSDSFCIFGNICEARETVWRMMGIEGELVAIMDYTRELADFAERAAEFNIELGRMQLADENISGLLIYGDVAYSNGLFMSPLSWRKIYKPALAEICYQLKKFGKPLVYHTDGSYLDVLDDLIEIGIDATHPNEAKAGVDAVKLRSRYGKRIAFLANIDATVLSESRQNIKQELEYKLQAAGKFSAQKRPASEGDELWKSGGFIPGGDDIPSSVSPENYDYYINLLKKITGSN